MFLAACVDDAPTPIAPDSTALLSQVQSPAEGGPDLVLEPRFEIEVDVEGALKPGRPIHLTVRGQARHGTADAEVRLFLPELAAAERSSWDLIDIPVGEDLPPQFRVRKGFAAGESFRERATITFPEPGYYYVLATVLQHSDDPRTDAKGQLIGSGAGRELWLWVDERGGRITDRFDPMLFPAGTRRVRGPLSSEKRPPRVRHGDVVITCSISPAGGDFTASSTGCPPPPDSSMVVNRPAPNATAAVTVTYSDAGTGGTVRPLVDAWVAWKVFNTTTNAEIARSGGYTNGSGVSPTIDCLGPTSERRLEVTVHTENRKAEVKSYITSNPDRTLAGQYFGACGGSIPITADNQQAHLFTNLNKNYDGHQRIFFSVPTTMKAGLYPVSSYGTRYDWGSDHVRIEQTWDHIWREMGVMAAAHEWGHLWQDKYLYESPATNGLMRFYNAACPNPHPPGEYTNFGCAFGEAFADWYAAVVRESDLPTWRRDLEENRLHLLHCGQKCTSDGSIVQGAVHAFLWDIVDPAWVESHDRIQKPAADVVASIKGCKISIDRVTYKPYTGIDHLIWCMERRFPYQVRMQKTYGTGDTLMTFFNTRPSNQWVNDASGHSVANLSDDFRRLWLVNLYSRRENVGTVPVFRAISADETSPPDEAPTEPTNPTDPGCGTELVC
ncbi:hypothetical protein [Longimicrobium sp.]|jgi:hypothetical protein|uniref:hypothetical protein n=1 Tax=Longimicrobium sp. TaxID=2029185 RepID=UPI002ED907CC